MPLNFLAPVTQVNATNPADGLLEQNPSLDLGFCEPRLNGVSMLQSFGVMRELPPSPLREPTQNVDRPVLNGDWRLRLQAAANPNEVSWQISIPPEPVNNTWRSKQTSGMVINQLIEKLSKAEPSFLPMVRQKFENRWNFHLVLHPLPDAASFMNHIRWHEAQHAADHRWLAEQIIGPWQRWVDAAVDKDLSFTCSDRNHMISAVTNPSAYALSTIRIVRYWQTALAKAGDLYHRTLQGGTPQIRFQKLAGTARVTGASAMELHLTIAAAQRIVAPITYQSAPHTIFALPPMNKTLTGNDRAIEPNGVQGQRDLNRPDVHGAAPNASIAIEAPAEDDALDMSGFFQ